MTHFRLNGHERRAKKTLKKAHKMALSYNEGLTVVQIAKRYRITRSRVYQILSMLREANHSEVSSVTPT